MTGKINAKELKEPDKLQTAFLDFMRLISENRQKVYLISAVLFIFLFVAGGYYLYRLDYEKKSDILFTKVFDAKMKGATPNDKDVNPIDAYAQVISKYPKSRAALLAQYRMGNIYFEQGETDKAIQAYGAFLSRSKDDNDIKTLTHTGLGYCYEIKKDYQSALTSFQKALATKEGVIFAGMTYRNIARIYEQMNDHIKAVEYYKKALTETKDPPAELLIKRKISQLS
ncbi:MAG: tetratricopeptide repeat protein [Syntrophaceae bacterium]|nr:tetratricopeptide repeat protein [Syntrophaceae bacterium]